MKQKEIFYSPKFTRNQQGVGTRKLPEDDALLKELLLIPVFNQQKN